jgi:hypothetical protein
MNMQDVEPNHKTKCCHRKSKFGSFIDGVLWTVIFALFLFSCVGIILTAMHDFDPYVTYTHLVSDVYCYDMDGSKIWYKNGKIHRDDGPAIIAVDGSQFWSKDGKRHREDGPAVVRIGGAEEYWLNGKQYTQEEFEKKLDKADMLVSEGVVSYLNSNGELHNLNGPARIYPNGVREWYKNGFLHRTDGPAVINTDGSEQWYLNGLIHRDGGPAVIYVRAYSKWYTHGKLNRNDGPAVEYVNGTKKWYKNGLLHRVDGPAIMEANGDLYWFKDGELHRGNGPAVVGFDGVLEWCLNGKRHRLDGPAYISPASMFGKHEFVRPPGGGPLSDTWSNYKAYVQYWIGGKQCVTEDEYNKAVDEWMASNTSN